MRIPGSLVVLFFGVLVTAGEAQPVTPPLAGREIAPRLRAAAAAAGISLDGAAAAPTSGSSVVVWIGSSDGKRINQWLVQLSRPVTAPARPAQDKTITHYLSWGRQVTFVSTRETLDLWIAGPVSVDATTGPEPVATRRTQIQIPADYLGFGLDASARVCRQIAERSAEAARRGQPINLKAIYSLTQPVDPRGLPASQAAAAAIGFTPELERAWIGGMVALGAFYESIDGVRELKEITMTAVKRPSAWKLLKAAGGTPFATAFNPDQVQEVSPALLGLPPASAPTFRLPFTLALDADQMTSGELIVTKPTGAIELTAGILGLIAVHPEDPRRIVQLSVVSTK